MADVQAVSEISRADPRLTPELAALVALLQEGAPAEADGLTTHEWAARIGRGEDSTRAMIKKLLAAGLMKYGRANRVNMAGIYHAENVYQLVSK